MKRYVHVGSLGIMLLVVFSMLLVNIYKGVDYPRLKSAACLDQYTPEEMEFFVEVGFQFRNVVCKWEDDILISIEGKATKEDSLVVDRIVEELKPLIYPVAISRTTGVGNLVIKFTNDTIYRQLMGFTDTKKLSYRGEISKVEMEIFSKVKGQARQACIRHEFLHALGLTHPKESNTGTLIEPRVEYMENTDNVKLYKFSTLDESSLRILYSNCLPVGLKKETLLKALDQ